MLDWLKRRIDAFFSWLTESLTEYFKWAKDVVDAWYKWAADLIKAIFKAAWDMFTDAVSWLIEKLFEIIKAALDAVDVSPLKGIADTDPAALADSPSAPQNSANVLVLNDGFWVDRIDELNAKWTAWSAR